MHGIYIGRGRVLVAPVWGCKMIVPSDDLSISPDLVLHGFYDAPLTNYLLHTLQPGQRCFDIGANLGTFTLLMAARVGLTGSITAYEASPIVLPFLRENVALNYMAKWVEIVDRAAYSRYDSLTFHATTRFQGNGSLLAHDRRYLDEYTVDAFETSTVLAEPLDERIGDQPVDLIKIDVEGTEPDVFAGMAKSIDAGLVRTVVFEFLRERIRDRIDDFAELLRRYDREDWHFSQIAGDGSLVPLGVEYMIAVGDYPQVVMHRRDV